jgi:uncharacterized protein
VRLLPKDDTFWHFFTKETAALSLASDVLAKALKEGTSGLTGAVIRIKTIERESALTLHDLQIRLHKTFVTPIDPEDISLLFEQLDHLLDDLDAIAYRVTAYRLDPAPPLMVELADRIHSSAELIEKPFGLHSVNDPTEDLCKEIMSMEEQTDQAIREGITRLFIEESDAVAVMKQKDIYDVLSA